MQWTYSKLSLPGGRSRNEDCVVVRTIGGAMFAAVADGLGGEGGGDIASRTAVSAATGFFGAPPIFSVENIHAAVARANTAVLQAQNKQNAMKTTLVLFCAENGKAVCGHVGDSRLYHLRGEKILFQTRDHSVSQMAVLAGEITQSGVRRHADRNKLLRALGAADQVSAEINELAIQKGDGFLLCTDGFWELILEDEIAESFIYTPNANQWLEKMCRRVETRLTDKSDNYSAVALRI